MEKTSTAPTNTPLPSRAALYVRMSTEHQQYSPENQSDVIRQYAASHNMEVVQVYSDHGRSGLNIAGREGLNQLMSDVGNKQANFSALLVYDVSRWGWFQYVDESAYYEYALKRAGIRVHYSSRADVADTEPNVEATWGGSVVWLKARDQLAHLAIGQSEVNTEEMRTTLNIFY